MTHVYLSLFQKNFRGLKIFISNLQARISRTYGNSEKNKKDLVILVSKLYRVICNILHTLWKKATKLSCFLFLGWYPYLFLTLTFHLEK